MGQLCKVVDIPFSVWTDAVLSHRGLRNYYIIFLLSPSIFHVDCMGNHIIMCANRHEVVVYRFEVAWWKATRRIQTAFFMNGENEWVVVHCFEVAWWKATRRIQTAFFMNGENE